METPGPRWTSSATLTNFRPGSVKKPIVRRPRLISFRDPSRGQPPSMACPVHDRLSRAAAAQRVMQRLQGQDNFMREDAVSQRFLARPNAVQEVLVLRL